MFVFCVGVFLKQKISYTFDLCGRVGDKKYFTRPISGNKTTFFLAGMKIILWFREVTYKLNFSLRA